MKEIAICNGVSIRANAGDETGQPVPTLSETAKAAGRKLALVFEVVGTVKV